ncbi:PDR/VanB family oxidoreductase [Ramlibacter rhizophilus]|uniref:Oxidoreductase n=1 Tax=Ramlibacter rhizophilus TaxID=1781167 RepID=A0A4Z0BF07_9BURK|nr:PDR/VanB family oxidoreductase [Ramlibacter rhizophilus]TFY97261.1 oxidoreductase [Ramlibacter rhizophilus]
MSLLQARVRTLRHEAEGVIGIELVPAPGHAFPPFEAGAHIDLHLQAGFVRSYSLLNDPAERGRYLLGVLNDRASRGGSRWVHEQLRVGTVLSISAPRNHFMLDEQAAHSVLVAGGIGITPLLSMARRLKSLGRSFELIYLARSREQAAFTDDVRALDAPVTWHFDAEHGGPPDLRRLLEDRPAGRNTHYYACGPAPMLDAFERHCAELGYAQVHVERFAAVEIQAAADARAAYTVELRSSGKLIAVTPGQTLLQAIRASGVEPLTSCEDGICGACETRVIEGCPDHRDSVLSAAEREAGRSMMICVGGCRSDRLVLEL